MSFPRVDPLGLGRVGQVDRLAVGPRYCSTFAASTIRIAAAEYRELATDGTAPSPRIRGRHPLPGDFLLLERNSLYFPYISGNRSQRRVRPRLLPPPLRWLEQRLLAMRHRRTRKIGRFRGVLAVGVLRIRTGDCRFGGRRTPRPAFFSVARCCGSGWLSRERQGRGVRIAKMAADGLAPFSTSAR